MRVTFDTNILISATFWYGASFRLMEKIENKELTLVLSKPILEEYVKVLNYDEIINKVIDKNLEVKQSVEKIIEISEIIETNSNLAVIKEDPDDNRILECAFDGKVDYLITNDNHLLKLKEFRGIKIITPEEALKNLK